MNYHILDRKIRDLQDLPQFAGSGIDADAANAFSHAVEGLSAWELLRINPLAFAERFNFRPDQALDLFLFGACVGLFAFEWILLCPACGGRERSYRSLRGLDRDVYGCSFCGAEAAVEAGTRLEVAFSVPFAVSGVWPDASVTPAEYRSYFFPSSPAEDPAPAAVIDPPAPRRSSRLRFLALPAGKRARVSLKADDAPCHRLVSLDTHSVFTVRMKDDPDRAPEVIDLIHTEAGFAQEEAFAPLTDTEVRLENRSRSALGCLIGSPDPAFLRELIGAPAAPRRPFISGKMMLNLQTFRDLFLADGLPVNLSLKIDDLTLLFTGAGERAGGDFAEQPEPECLRILSRIANRLGGAITPEGGGVLATFNNPADGTRAAAQMLEAADGIGLTIGLHRGPVVAVNAGRPLDFFGQTVNTASRVREAAGAGEIWITDDVMRDEDAAAFLRAAGYSAVAKDVAIQGVGGLVRVFSCRK